MVRLWASAAVAALVTGVAGQTCIPLTGSTTCPAFSNASISTNAQLVGFFPFLAFVANVQDFDREMSQYVSQTYVQSKYQNLFGCTNINLANTTNYYARFTTSFVCNSIVQNSRTACSLSDTVARPLCADSCASFATSEEQIVTSNQFCAGRSSNYVSQLRADFTDCAIPANSLSGSCVTGASNEPNMCGFGNNLVGLCNYCRTSTVNATDSCCYFSNATSRCDGVSLPIYSSIAGLFSTTSAPAGSTPTASTGASNNSGSGGGGLSGGAIAGIVVGSIVGALLILGLIVFCCLRLRRRRQDSTTGSILNQPSPQRKGGDVSAMTYNPPASAPGYEVLPGGRVARMSAMQSEATPERNYGAGIDPYGDSPVLREKPIGIAGGMKMSPGSNDSSPESNNLSSPEGVASGQSEQLPFFKDYYSNDDIHPNDKVSVLWAYSPRAGDEFELERGDMLKVVGIWDDGWATGVRIDDRAEDYDGKHKLQRDSGVSNGSARRADSPVDGEIKAFPLVCVCMPEAWKKTVEGDTSTESGSGGLHT